MIIKILSLEELKTFIEDLNKFIDNFNSIPEDRLKDLDYEFKPKNEKEFILTINESPLNILKGLGFKKWLDYKESNRLNPDSNLEVEDKHNFDIWLFPSEWEDIIPLNFQCVNPNGEEVLYKKSSEPMLGVLPYGIKRPHNADEPNELYEEFKNILFNGIV